MTHTIEFRQFKFGADSYRWCVVDQDGYRVETSGEIQHVSNSRDGQAWHINGMVHRENDLPAIIEVNGDQHWLSNGVEHRGNGLPAVELANGTKFWYIHGKAHREDDLPAIERASGDKTWYKNGLIHRDNDLPAIEAVSMGYQIWYQHGQKHRLNGPAYISNRGEEKYFIKNKEYSKNDFIQEIAKTDVIINNLNNEGLSNLENAIAQVRKMRGETPDVSKNLLKT